MQIFPSKVKLYLRQTFSLFSFFYFISIIFSFDKKIKITEKTEGKSENFSYYFINFTFNRGAGRIFNERVGHILREEPGLAGFGSESVHK